MERRPAELSRRPAGKGGASESIFDLIRVGSRRLELHPTLEMNILTLVVTAIGAVALVSAAILILGFKHEPILLFFFLPFGLLFFCLGLAARRDVSRKCYFDLDRGLYWVGAKDPAEGSKRRTNLQECIGIQLLSKQKSSAGSNLGNYVCYEMNLVKKDNSRTHVFDSGNFEIFIDQVTEIAELLSLPVWDDIEE